MLKPRTWPFVSQLGFCRPLCPSSVALRISLRDSCNIGGMSRDGRPVLLTVCEMSFSHRTIHSPAGPRRDEETDEAYVDSSLVSFDPPNVSKIDPNSGQKIRAACDRCRKQKLRCHRKHHSSNSKCERCTSAGTTCSFSASRRAGRPRVLPGSITPSEKKALEEFEQRT